MSESNGALGYIHDGYTRDDGYIRGEDRLHPSLYFTWRPPLALQRSRVMREIGNHDQDAARGEQIAATLIAKQLQSWDLTDHKRTAVEITPENVLRLQSTLYHKLWGVVMGTRAPDAIERPEENSGPDIEALLEDESPEAFLAKNSSTG